MSRLSLAVAVAAAALALAAGPADAAVTVAGGLPNATLAAADISDDGQDQLQLSLIGPIDAGDPEEFFEQESGTPPLWPDETIVAAQALPSIPGTTRMLVGGAVNVAAASVELTFDDAHVLRLDTLEGSAYQGKHAGQVRFFLGETTTPEEDASDDVIRMRTFDASGALIGVPKSPDATQRVRLMRRRAGGAVIRMDATLTSRLAAIPGAPEHRSDELCIAFGVNEPTTDGDSVCQSRFGPMQLGGRRGCESVPTTLAGFAPAATDAIVLRLGSGSTFRAPTRAAPFGRTERAVTALLPAGEAIRTAVAVDAAGHHLASADAAVAPPDRRCPSAPRTYELDNWVAYADAPEPQFGTPPGTEVAATAGDRRIVVRDSGDDLCFGIDRLDLAASDCFPPPFTSHETGMYVDPDGRLVAAVFAARVTALDLHFQGGGTMRIPAIEGTGYTGRYRSATHFAFAQTPPGKLVTDGVLLDADGRQVGTAFADGPALDETLVRRPTTVLSTGSGLAAARLVVGGLRGLFSSRTFPCVGLELGAERSDCDDEYLLSSNTVNARVTCGTRQTVLFGIARADVGRVDIRLSNGREIQPRMARVPAGLGTRSRVYLVVLPRDVAVTRVHFSRKHVKGRSDNAVMPTRSPARQCGYDFRETVY